MDPATSFKLAAKARICSGSGRSTKLHWLLTLGAGKELLRKEGTEDIQSVGLSWLGIHAETVAALFVRNHRLAQEYVTWDFLQSQPPD